MWIDRWVAVDEEDAASWRDERSRSSRTSDIPTDSMLDGDDVREDEEDGQQQYYEDTESETEYSKAQLYMGDEDDAGE